MTPIFKPPTGMVQIAHFVLPRVKTWGGQDDAAYKEDVRETAMLVPEDVAEYDWLAFSIRCVVGESRGRYRRQTPDVENIPKLIVDAFSGLPYPDDNLHYVRGVQVEAEWGPDEEERAEVWIYGWTAEAALEEEMFYQEQWDERRAHSRSIEEMRQIALEAMDLPDDNEAFYLYGKARGLTVNEVAYYLNAYEYGGEAGLQALTDPDVIPPGLAGRAIKRIKRALDELPGESPCRVTDEGTAIGVYEVQQRYHTDREYLFPVCQFRLTVETGRWHLYWMRKFDAWWPYSLPERGHKYALEARIRQLLQDKDGCFWG